MNFFRDELREYYDEDSTTVPFIAVMYWSIGEDGEKIWRFWDLMLLVACVVTIVSSIRIYPHFGIRKLQGGCFAIIVFSAVKIYWKMKNAGNNMSKRTIELNRQLFVTLSFQVNKSVMF